MIIAKNEVNSKLKRYTIKEKISHISYMLDREEEEERRLNLTVYSEHYGISRQTMYSYLKKFIENHSDNKAGRKRGSKKNTEKKWIYFNEQEKTKVIRTILISAVSPVSIREIKAIVKEAFEIELSRRKIKEILEKYSLKAKELFEKIQPEKYVKFLAIDEIFSGNKPILTGVELESFAVVICQKAQKRDSATWKEALSNFENLELVASDQATGIISAVAKKGVKHQFDLFHVKRDIGKLLRHLEAQAYKEIELEYKTQIKWQKEKNDKEKLFYSYQECQKQARKTIHVFDEIEKSIKIIYQAMETFDKKGNFIDPQKSLKKIHAASERMKKASNNKKIINLAKRVVHPKLLLYLIELKDRLLSFSLQWKKGCKAMTRRNVFRILAKHYFFSNLPKPSLHFKNNETKKELLLRRILLKKRLEKEHLQNLFDVRILQMSLRHFDTVFTHIKQALARTFRSSSLVESFNSQIRVAQQVKKSLHQNFLALSILKWNLTPFENGKRKGKFPFELLGIPLKHKNWLDILLSN